MKKLLTLAALAAGLSLAGVAAAEPGTGATVVDDEYCIGSPFATWCWDVKTITNVEKVDVSTHRSWTYRRCEAGTTSTTHVPHRLSRVAAGPSRCGVPAC